MYIYVYVEPHIANYFFVSHLILLQGIDLSICNERYSRLSLKGKFTLPLSSTYLYMLVCVCVWVGMRMQKSDREPSRL